MKQLWFDVGIKRYTTVAIDTTKQTGCGLMQESKDIQRILVDIVPGAVVV